MQNFKVRTYSVQRETPKMALFILNRGRNAGKPLFEPCPNCFILYCKDREEVENLYWIFYALWKSKFFRPYLCGSAIDMLRLSELKELLKNWIIPSLTKIDANKKLLENIKVIYLLEQKTLIQLQNLDSLRSVLIKKLYYAM